MKFCGTAYPLIAMMVLVLLQCQNSLAAINTDSQVRPQNFTLDGDTDNNPLHIQDNELRVANVTILHSPPGLLNIQSSDKHSFIIINQTDFVIAQNASYPLTFQLLIKGKYLGIADLHFYLTTNESTTLVGTIVVKVERSINQILVKLFRTGLTVMLCMSYVTMGSKVDLQIIRNQLKRPLPVLIGMVCQFVILPATAFGLCKLFLLDDAASVGLVTDGTSPGGFLSNMFTLLLDCNVTLSLTMTFLSTFLALGMMPLNLFLYTTPFTEENEALKAPFVGIVAELLILLIPLAFGMALTYKFKKLKKIFNVLVKPFVIIIMIVIIAGIPAGTYVVFSSWQIWVSSLVFPLTGGLLGFTLAKIACMENRAAITIALETACQNNLLARNIIEFFYPLPESELILRVPTLIFFFTLFEGLVLVVCYEIWKRFNRRQGNDENDLEKAEDEEQVKSNGENKHDEAHKMTVTVLE